MVKLSKCRKQKAITRPKVVRERGWRRVTPVFVGRYGRNAASNSSALVMGSRHTLFLQMYTAG